MGSTSTSPGSESPREPVQHDIETTSARLTLQGVPTSPRNALLSQTSLQHPTAEPTTAPPADSHSRRSSHALDKKRDIHKRGSSERRTRSSGRHLSLIDISKLELDRLRNDPKAEALKMRDLLETAVRQIHVESKRAEDLQRINDETAMKYRILNENRLTAQQEAAKVKTELKLYQYQLDSAQKEIEKAKVSLKDIERQRDKAEEAAARAREKARKYQQERLVAIAREEGRKLGYEAGFTHAKKEKEILAAGRHRFAAQAPSRSSKGKERAYYPEDAHRSRHYPYARNTSPSSPDDSPPQTPRRTFRGSSHPVVPNRQPHQGSAAAPSSRHQSGPPSEKYDHEDDYESESDDSAPPPRPVRATTPSIQYWSVDIPAADRIHESFNSNEHPNNAIPQGPREEWVSAKQHHEIRGSPNVRAQNEQKSKSPATVPQTQLGSSPKPQRPVTPAAQPMPSSEVPIPIVLAVDSPDLPAKPLIKNVKFWARRPKLAKTKQHATSWYRSFSLRKKNKPVIDPIAEEEAHDDIPQPQGPADPLDGGMYVPRPQQSQSWYRSNASSLRNQDMNFARRQQSDVASVVSTRVSQFDLLATPAQLSFPNNSLPRMKNKMKERDNLSVIKEVSSRGNTPDRPLGVGGPSQVIPYPMYHPPGFHPSYASSSGSAQNRQSRRPPEIFVPNHDSALPSAGNSGYTGYPSNPNLSGKHSIDINVVPPSGLPQDGVISPPHTGRNHLSPLHVFPSAESGFADQPGRPNSAAAWQGHIRAPSNDYDRASPLQRPQAPYMTWSGSRPGSVGPAASNRQLRNASSTATFRIANPDPPPADNVSARSPRAARVDVVPDGEDGVHSPPRREPSRASMKSTKSYSRYNPDKYIDPAYWGVGGPGEPTAALPAQPRPGMEVAPDDLERAASRLSRRTSINSGLSYA